jgi:hypothetical protein
MAIDSYLTSSSIPNFQLNMNSFIHETHVLLDPLFMLCLDLI